VRGDVCTGKRREGESRMNERPDQIERAEIHTQTCIKRSIMCTNTHTQIHRHTDTQTHRHTDTQTHIHTGTQTHRHTNEHTTQNLIHNHRRKHTHARTCWTSPSSPTVVLRAAPPGVTTAVDVNDSALLDDAARGCMPCHMPRTCAKYCTRNASCSACCATRSASAAIAVIWPPECVRGGSRDTCMFDRARGMRAV
jgi:hypothetical protein